MFSTSQLQSRKRGRPRQTEFERLRTSLTFFSLKTISGLSWAALESSFLVDTCPDRLQRMERKPEDFLKYAKGTRSPRKQEIPGSPLAWALSRYPKVTQTYHSLVFAAIKVPYEQEDLIRLSIDLYRSNPAVREVIFADFDHRYPVGLGWRFKLPLGMYPRDVSELRLRPELDALCALLIALKTNVGTPAERQCALLVVEWAQSWVRTSIPPEHLIERLFAVLAEHMPPLREFFFGAPSWLDLRADLSLPCFQPCPVDDQIRRMGPRSLRPYLRESPRELVTVQNSNQ